LGEYEPKRYLANLASIKLFLVPHGKLWIVRCRSCEEKFPTRDGFLELFVSVKALTLRKRFDWLKLFPIEFELTNQRALLKEYKERTFPITSRYYYIISISIFLPMHWSVPRGSAP
jgi:hypothetical protein